MRKIQVGKRKVGDGEPAFVIAEAGINHNGKISIARRLVQEAAKQGADAIKFQIFKTEELCSRNSEYFGLFKSVELTKDEWHEVADCATDCGIMFSASVFGEYSADLLAGLGAPAFKIASGDITHFPLLRYVAAKKRPIILSTGMSNLEEVEQAVRVIREAGHNKIILMHCLSEYPADTRAMNLKAIQTMKRAFDVPVGFSDHSEGRFIVPIAVAVGANLIEKHFTLNKNLHGPDHKLSLDAGELRQMIKEIRIVEAALGDGKKRPTMNEIEAKRTVRRSIAASKCIRKGETLTIDSLRIVRPGNGLEPRMINKVVGKTAKRAISKDEILRRDDIWPRVRR